MGEILRFYFLITCSIYNIYIPQMCLILLNNFYYLYLNIISNMAVMCSFVS